MRLLSGVATSCWAFCVLAVLWPVGARAESAAGSAGSLLAASNSLVTQYSPDEAQEVRAAQQAALESPESVLAREQSRTAYEGFGWQAAADLALRSFPELIDVPDGGLPRLPAGQRVTGYVSDFEATTELPEGKHGVIASTSPLATQEAGSEGQRVPVDFDLSEVGGAFEPKTPTAGLALRIPKQFGQGVSLGASHVSMTQVDEQGDPLGGSEGVRDGAVVFYGGTGLDTDSFVKPVAAGFMEDAVLRSTRSPSTLFYEVGMPEGARLAQPPDAAGEIDVVDAGQTIATIAQPSAQDAQGTSVPLSVGVTGKTLRLSVEYASGSYAFPITVDPTISETNGGFDEVFYPGTWGFYTENSSIFQAGKYYIGSLKPEYGVEDIVSKSVQGGEQGFFYYPTQGESKIYSLTAATSFTGLGGGRFENLLGIWNVNSGTYEGSAHTSWIEDYSALSTLCAEAGCAPGSVTPSNEKSEVFFTQLARETNAWDGGTSKMSSVSLGIVQEAGPTASFIPVTRWIRPAHEHTVIDLNAFDPGLGVHLVSLTATPKSPAWSAGLSPCSRGVQCEECYETSCGGAPIPADAYGLPEGEDAVEASVEDIVKLQATAKTTVKVDNAAPFALAITGLPSGNELADEVYRVGVKATDGKEGTVSSGIRALVLSVDGRELSGPSISCPLGPCTAAGEVAIDGKQLAAGQHQLTLTAVDGAGNIAQETVSLTVRHASPVALAPGLVNPQSGELGLRQTDVSLPGGLTIGRSYQSEHLSAGVQGPLGPQWAFSLGGHETLVKQPNGSMVLTDASGLQTLFATNGKGEFNSPSGDANLTLVEVTTEGVKEYVLKNSADNTSVGFRVPSSGSGEVWVPSISKGPVATDTVTFSYETATVGTEQITRPVQELAPVPAGVSCSPTLSKGCQALTFNYASSTTASGEASSEWGDYVGHLTRAYVTEWDPASKEMKTVTVAQYAYDTQGRLRAEWDPRISPALKTTYGYDAEGHVTALAPAGAQPWLMDYGTISGDSTTGRLIGVTRPAAATARSNASAPQNTVSPALSTTEPSVGKALTVTNGAWSNSPLTYAYQWEDCNSVGEECTPVLGATNQGYIPSSGDAGHTLAVEVRAGNANGSVAHMSAVSKTVSASSAPTYASQFGSAGAGNGQFKAPHGVALDSSGNVWVTDTENNRVQEFSSTGTYLQQFGSTGAGNGQFKMPTGIQFDSKGYLWVLDAENSRVEKFSSTGEYLAQFKTTTLPYGLNIDKEGHLWITGGLVGVGEVVTEYSQAGEAIRSFGAAGSGPGQFKEPRGIAVAANGDVWVADRGNGRLQVFSASGEYLAAYSVSQASGVTFDPGGEVWVTSPSKVEEMSPLGTVLANFGSSGSGNGQFSGAWGVTTGPGSKLWVVDSGNARVQSLSFSSSEPGPPAPPSPGSNAVSTIEYQVPLTGVAAAHQMGSTELSRWGQTDDPIEATAIFPPDDPQSWPAQNYKRATVYYLDRNGRTVNVASPGGAISTSEFNATNNLLRSLSADNRATALKEGAKSAEASRTLDTQSTYNSEGTELLSTLGPQHKVKLSNGKEVQARSHTVYSYDEGAPSEGGPYLLATKVTQGAQTEAEGEQDVRTTTTSYSGQEDLGWKLRKPTSVTSDPTGLKLVRSTIYDPITGNVVETRAPGAGPIEHSVPTYVYQSKWGSFGSGAVPLFEPYDAAIDSKGHVWALDTFDDRVVEMTSSGEYISRFGGSGSGNGHFNRPSGIAIDAEGHIWIADTYNERVQEFSSEGVYMRQFGTEGTGNGQFKAPVGISIGAGGNLWVTDLGNHRVQEFSSEGAYIRQFGTEGTGNGQFKSPWAIAVDGEGHVWVTDLGNHRVQELSSEGAYMRQFGTEGTGNGQFKEPAGITIDSAGHLWVSDWSNENIQEFSSEGTFIAKYGTEGSGNAQFKHPVGVTSDSSGNLWIADAYNDRVQEMSTGGSYLGQAPVLAAQLALNHPASIAIDAAGNELVADTENHRVQEVSSTGGFLGQSYDSYYKPDGIALAPGGESWVTDETSDIVLETGGSRCEFGGPGTGNGQFNEPAGIALTGESVYVLDRGNSRVEEFDTKCEYERQFGTAGSGPGQLSHPQGIAVDGEGGVWVADTGNNRIEKFSSTGTYIKQYGTLGAGNGQFSKPEGLAFDAAGRLWVADTGNSRLQEFYPNGLYIQQLGTKGSGSEQLNGPTDVTFDKANDMYILDAGNSRVEEWAPTGAPHEITSNGGTHATQTIYYTATANGTYPACGEHPEWADLPCRTQPAAQPETAGLPNLPVITQTYNMWGQPETVTQTVGSTTRTTTLSYDSDGRALSSKISSSVGTALPSVNDEYSTETGALVKQSTTSGGKTQAISSVLNTLGEMTSYTDADGNTSTYKYDIDGRVEEVNDGKGSQLYTYDPITGAPSSVADSAAGTFTAAYDPEGRLTSESYPNGMSANYSYNQAGEATGLQYVKTSHCSTECDWFTDALVPSIHGQTLGQESSLATQSYDYDGVGRLVEVQETPAGKGCLTREYSYDDETNRTSESIFEPGSKGECATASGTTETHTYDQANRLLDTGVKYDEFGNTTVLPAADAGGSELTSTFYTSNKLATQTQGGQTIGYQLDPAGRTRETVSTGKIVASVINHYSGPGETPAWSSEQSGQWTRYITGISGGLAAIQRNGEAPVLQLTDLKGNIVATAADNESESKLLGTSRTTEYGVPTTEAPAKYAWLGAHEIPTELPSGVVVMGVRSYVPQLGRFLQTDPVPGGSVNAYAYTYGDPVNSTDLSGAVSSPSQSLIKGMAQIANGSVEEQAAENAAAAAEAARKAEEAEELFALASGSYGEEWEEEEWWEEEEGYEYANYHNAEHPIEHTEEGLLYQPLTEASEAEGESGAGRLTATTPTKLCSSSGKDMPCASDVGALEFIEKFGHEAEHLYHKGKRFVHKLLRGLRIHAPSTGAYECAAVGVGVSFLLTDSPFATQAAIGALSGIGCAGMTN